MLERRIASPMLVEPPSAVARALAMFVFFGASFFSTSVARAGDPEKADALFRQGRAALERGQYVRACELLRKSLDEDPAASGTLMNLAYCHQVTGKFWQAYVEYAEAARTATSADRRDFAMESMHAVAEKLPKIALQFGDEGARVLREDGTAIDDPRQPFPVEPGHRIITLVAPNGARRELALDVPARAGVVAVIVTSNGTSSTTTLSPTEARGEPTPTSSPNTAADGSTRRQIALGVGALGIAGLAAGTYFGLKSFAIRDSACPGPTKDCDAAGLERIHGSATTTAVLSTIFFGVGLAGIAGGIALFVLPNENAASSSATILPIVGRGYGGVAVERRF
jgi:hypothetical protein